MSEVITNGLVIAKNAFPAHGAVGSCGTVFSRRLTSGKLLDFVAQRSGMRFVAIKSEEQQAAVMVFRTCDIMFAIL